MSLVLLVKFFGKNLRNQPSHTVCKNIEFTLIQNLIIVDKFGKLLCRRIITLPPIIGKLKIVNSLTIPKGQERLP
ncbi:hypothetical protein B0G76_7473 [Paraburkholderia sp. BL23I1N1]|nr:hypothetical protein B0G76_7473 [Paraburkholderia sp. BL23I1N1]